MNGKGELLVAWTEAHGPNSSIGQPISSEQVASSVGISTRLCCVSILADSPMNFTPATTRELPGCSLPNRAISSESPTIPPVSSARSCTTTAG